MNDSDLLTVRAAVHPDPTVARFGFELDHPYLERCWTSHLGPAAVVLLHRLAAACREEHPVHVSVIGLAGELGVQPATLRRTLHRVTQFGFITLDRSYGALAVYATIPPLNDRQLDRVPTDTVLAHHRLLDEQLDHRAPPTTEGLTQRLDRLQHQPATSALER